MTIEATATAPATTSIAFRPGPDTLAWSHLDITDARIGVLYQCDPQPHITLFPPVRVPEGCTDDFLEAVLRRAQNGGSPGWMKLSVDPLDGEITFRINLASEDPDEIERALQDAQAFFETNYRALASACLPARNDDEEDEDEESILDSFLHRFFER